MLGLCLVGYGADSQAELWEQDIQAERRQSKAITVGERASLENMHAKGNKRTGRELAIIEFMPDTRNCAVSFKKTIPHKALR